MERDRSSTKTDHNLLFTTGSNRKMQSLVRAVRYWNEQAQIQKLRFYKGFKDAMTMEQSQTKQEKGLQNTTVAEVLMTKEEENVGSWLWCRTEDTVYDAVKQMARNNIGSLVVLKPGEQQLISGIFTERDYLRKMIMQDRSCKHTKVAEIMTNQEKLITVTSDTNILQAMQLMADNHIRHAPVIDGRIVGMISITDVVKAVIEQQHGEVKRLNEFIQGDYY